MEEWNHQEAKYRSTRKTYLGIYLTVTILLTATGYLYFKDLVLSSNILLILLVLALLGIKYVEVDRLKESYTLTPEYVVHKKGLFFIESKRMFIPIVTDATVTQNPWKRLLNYGTVNLHMFADEALQIKNINNPWAFVEEIEKRKRNIEKRKHRNEEELQ